MKATLINYTKKDETSNSIVRTLQFGTTYKNIDTSLKYDKYNFDTNLNNAIATAIIHDKYSLSILVGVMF